MTHAERIARGIKAFTDADGGLPAIREQTRPVDRSPDVSTSREEPTAFDPTYVGLTENLPERTALLCVTADHDRQLFKLHWFFDGRSDESRPADVDTQSRPPTTLAEILRTKEWESGYHCLIAWWSGLNRLATWTEDLLSARSGDERLRLIIWDNTSFQIPWETMYSDTCGRWVGGEVEVVRWTSINDIGRVASYTAEPAMCRGGVLALETEDIFGPAGPLLDAPLARYGATAKRNMWQLLTALNSSEQEFGLVLVRCHGVYGETTSEFELGGMKMTHYHEFRMTGLQTFPAVVFLNACDTASMTAPGRHSFVATRSFAELFLRRGANSVLATLGQIDHDHSHEFAVRLLEAEGVEQRLAALLLEHRRQAVRRVRLRPDDLQADSRDEFDFESFFQSFAYVCFGHPDTVLQLTANLSGGPS